MKTKKYYILLKECLCFSLCHEALRSSDFTAHEHSLFHSPIYDSWWVLFRFSISCITEALCMTQFPSSFKATEMDCTDQLKLKLSQLSEASPSSSMNEAIVSIYMERKNEQAFITVWVRCNAF